jgi:hypothetical protein
MLHDFSSRTPDELLTGPTKFNGSQSAMPTSGRARNRPRSIRRVHVTLRRGGRSLDERYHGRRVGALSRPQGRRQE